MTQLLFVAWVLAAGPAADSWPGFRGDGSSLAIVDNLPLRWSNEANIAWTAEISGYGQSSPVVWRERVFVTSADGRQKETVLVSCFELQSGKLAWTKDFKGLVPQEVSDYISRAAPTPAVDDQHVYAFFETGNLVALDHAGNVVWQRAVTTDYGDFRGNHGVGSSLALTDKAVLVLVCHDGPSYLLAVDKATGKTLWKTDRPQEVSWSSPIYDPDQKQIIVSSNGTCEAIDADTGRQIWFVTGLKGNTVPSATLTKDRVIVGSSEVGGNLAIRRGGQGDVTGTHVAWRSADATATFSSPLVYQDHVYVVNRAGVAYCLDLASGKTVWTHRIGESCWTSPLGAGGRVYFFSKSGTTTVVAAGATLEVLSTNEFTAEDRVYGVAAVDRTFVLRSGSKLVCIRETTDKESTAPMNNESTSSKAEQPGTADNRLPDLPQALTSFGAAMLEGSLYVYGGHHGTPHHYSEAGQSGKLLQLDGKNPKEWKELAGGPKLQGLAMVAHGGKLYRAGGFMARNKEDQKQDLRSVADFASYDPRTNQWKDLPAMPAPRSSFDATLIGDTLYIVGGWDLRGDQDTAWLDAAYAIDLAREPLVWKELPKPPFQRRALSLGAVDGKLYVIGGMQADGKVTRQTAIYDPEARTWSTGPELPEGEMEGFGTACSTTGGRLYLSTISGKLLRLSDDGQAWELIKVLPDDRFFHQMLARSDSRLILMGGASMKSGKFASVVIVSPEK